MAVFTPAEIVRLAQEFASAQQGLLAESAAQSGEPISQFSNDVGYLTAVTTLALLVSNSYLKSGDNVSELTNNAGYLTGSVEIEEQTVTGTSLILPNTPLAWYQPQVFVNGALLDSTAYSIAGTTITFTAALTADLVQVVYAHGA